MQFTEREVTVIRHRIGTEYAEVEQVCWSLEEYAMHRVAKGHFLTAVLENDLMKAFQHADGHNTEHMRLIIQYVFMYLPTSCYGNTTKVRDWLRGRSLLNGRRVSNTKGVSR